VSKDRARKTAYLIAAGSIDENEVADIVRQYNASVAETESDEPSDDWSLNTDQMIFMLQHHNAIEDAYAKEDSDFICELTDSEAYKSLFGEMTFNEAYDRYESALEGDCGDP